MSKKCYNLKQFMLHVSYVGTQYQGITKNSYKSVISVIEEQLIKLIPENKPFGLKTSSRTDHGVHAFFNTVRFLTNSHYSFNSRDLRYYMNYNLSKTSEMIRIHQIKEIPLDVNIISNVFRRTYLYKIGLISNSNFLWNCATAWEAQQINFVGQPFDFDLFLETAKCISGNYNYCGFTNLEGMLNAKNPVKNLNIVVKESPPSVLNMHSHPRLSSNFPVKYIDIFVTAESFMNKMVRNLVGSMIYVAIGKCQLKDVVDVVNRGHYYLNEKPFRCAPPYALYLYDIEYENKLLNFDVNKWQEEPRCNLTDLNPIIEVPNLSEDQKLEI